MHRARLGDASLGDARPGVPDELLGVSKTWPGDGMHTHTCTHTHACMHTLEHTGTHTQGSLLGLQSRVWGGVEAGMPVLSGRFTGGRGS